MKSTMRRTLLLGLAAAAIAVGLAPARESTAAEPAATTRT